MTDLDRLCVHTITTKPWSMKDILEQYPAAGVVGVSVWRDRFQEMPPTELGRRIREAGMHPVSVVRGGFFAARSPEDRRKALDENRRAVDETANLEAPLLVLVCGAVPGQAISESLRQIEEGLEQLLPYAEEGKVKLGIEPLHPMYADSRSAVTTMRTANDLIFKFNSPYLGVVVDVFHVWWDPELPDQIKRAGDGGKLFAFHVCDWKQNMTDMLNDRGIMGEGIIRIPEIRAWMETAGFFGFIEVEIFSEFWWKRDQTLFLNNIVQAYQKMV